MSKTDICKCYEIIGVEPGVSPEQLKQAYRDLVNIWHPDRFASNPRLQEKAEEQLKRINAAYQHIRKTSLSKGKQGSSETPCDTKSKQKEETPPPPPGRNESEYPLSGKQKKQHWFQTVGKWLKKRSILLLLIYFGTLFVFSAVVIFSVKRLSPGEPAKWEETLPPSETVQSPPMQIQEKEMADSEKKDFTWLENLKQRIAQEKEDWRKREDQEKIGEAEEKVKTAPDTASQEKSRETGETRDAGSQEDKVPLFETIYEIIPKEKSLTRNLGKKDAPIPQNGSASEKKTGRDAKSHETDAGNYTARIPPQKSSEAVQKKNRQDIIRQYREYIRYHLVQSGTRYIAGTDGTVLDTRTGLMWCMLNSFQETGCYLDYGTAVRYVKTMRIGGYRNWRLPNSSELAEIYMTDPVFPNTEANWYWTSETYSKGWNRTARIVRPGKQKRIMDEYANLHERGMVHAVRTP